MESHQLDVVHHEKTHFTGIVAKISSRHIHIAVESLGSLFTGRDTQLRATRTVDVRRSCDHTVVLVGDCQIGRRSPGTTLHHESAAKGEQETVALVKRGVSLLRELCNMIG